MNMKIKQRGVTALEMVMTLVFIAVVGGAIALVANTIIQGTKVEKAYESIVTTSDVVFSSYNNRRNFSGVDIADIVAADLLPESMSDRGVGTARTPYGEIVVSALSIGCAGCLNGFYVEALRVPSDVCIKLTSKDYGKNVSRVLVSPFSAVNYVEVTGNIAGATARCQIEDEARIRVEYVR